VEDGVIVGMVVDVDVEGIVVDVVGMVVEVVVEVEVEEVVIVGVDLGTESNEGLECLGEFCKLGLAERGEEEYEGLTTNTGEGME